MKTLTIAVMNTSKEITDLLSEVFREEGFNTYSLFTYLIKEERVDFDTYVKAHRPDVIVYDVGIPYKENYELFKKLRNRKIVKNIPFVLTTTNKDALDKFVGKTNTLELIGKPYDLQEIIDAVKRASKTDTDIPTIAST